MGVLADRPRDLRRQRNRPGQEERLLVRQDRGTKCRLVSSNIGGNRRILESRAMTDDPPPDEHPAAVPFLKRPFWKSLALIVCGGVTVALLNAVFPAVFNLLGNKPNDNQFITLQEGRVDSINFTEPTDTSVVVVATLIFDHATDRDVGGVHLATGPCNAPSQTRDKGWIAVHSTGHGQVLPIPRGYCWNASLMHGAERASIWILRDRRWWQRKATVKLITPEVHIPRTAPVRGQ